MKSAVVRPQCVQQRVAPGTAAWLAALVSLATAVGAASEPVAWTSRTAALAPAVPTGAGAPASASRLEISTSTRPRFDSADGGARTQQRIDLALLSPGRAAFGVTLGLSAPSVAAATGLAPGSPEAVPGANLGLQWRYVLDNNRRVDITAWRDIGHPGDALAMVQSRDPGYGARVEMQLADSHRGFVADRGFVGMQLEGGARITLHRSGGKPMVYYRNRF